jgi:hypothetical protein
MRFGSSASRLIREWERRYCFFAADLPQVQYQSIMLIQDAGNLNSRMKQTKGDDQTRDSSKTYRKAGL